MSLLFDQPARSIRPRAVSNGGLGGFVQIEQLLCDQNHRSKSSWPKRRKRRPSEIGVGSDGSLLLTAWNTTSLVMQGCRSPVTPGDPWATNQANPAVKDMTLVRASAPHSCCNVTGRARVCTSMPGTPSTPESKRNLLPVELPGSLLLPSQGFPQSEPPVTPSRQTFGRSYSDKSSSTLSSTPELSTCSTVPAIDMDVLRSFSPKKRATKSAISSPSTASIHRIGKPFSAMTAEELIQCLPECSPAGIAQDWVPAMLREHQKIKNLLQDAAEIKMDANAELGDFGAKIESISNDVCKISTAYEHALRRAESISERDIKVLQENLQTAKADLSEALAATNGQRDIITEKEEIINEKGNIINVLCAFIEDTLPHSAHSLATERVHDVRQLIADYSRSSLAGRSGSPVQQLSPSSQSPEATCRPRLQGLCDIQAKFEGYQELVNGQNDLIKSQSADLDQRVIEYERCLKTIKERDHEILLLAERNNTQKKIIEEYEAGRVSEPAKSEQERLVRQHQNMEYTIRNLKRDHLKQIEDRDAEIENLRQKLGHAWEEVLARKADVKNVISQTQALLAPPELREIGPDTLFAGERKMLEKNKTNASLPSSRSMLSLSMSEATLGFCKLDVPAASLSAVDRITHENKPRSHMEPRNARIDDEGWGCGIARKKGSVPNLRPRPRKDSLGAMSSDRRANDLELLETIVKGSVDDSSRANSIATEKELPTPPDVHSGYGSVHNSDGGHSVTKDVLQNLLLTEAPHHSFHTPLSPRHRVLSGIPEMSVEDAESQKSSPSATSSEKEVYRKSMDALNLIEFMRESADYEGKDYGPFKVGVADEVRLARGSRSSIRFRNDSARLQAQESPTRTVSQIGCVARSSTRK